MSYSFFFIRHVLEKYADCGSFEPPVIIPHGVISHDAVALKGKSDIGKFINTEVTQTPNGTNYGLQPFFIN